MVQEPEMRRPTYREWNAFKQSRHDSRLTSKKACVSGNCGTIIIAFIREWSLFLPQYDKLVSVYAVGNSFDISRVHHTLSEP